jgi:hypothetical protein
VLLVCGLAAALGTGLATGGPAAQALFHLLENRDTTVQATGSPVPYPYAGERRAHVRTPDAIGGLSRQTDPHATAAAQKVLADVKPADAKEAVAAYYLDGHGRAKPVIVIAFTADIVTPGIEIYAMFNDAGNIENRHTVDPGPLGGLAECGRATDAGSVIVSCAWADHGSVGAVGFLDWPPDEAEFAFGQVHQAVLVRN